jgi:hypothetical protein
MELINMENDLHDLLNRKKITDSMVESLRKYKRLNQEIKELTQEMKAIELRYRRDKSNQKLKGAE